MFCNSYQLQNDCKEYLREIKQDFAQQVVITNELNQDQSNIRRRTRKEWKSNQLHRGIGSS